MPSLSLASLLLQFSLDLCCFSLGRTNIFLSSGFDKCVLLCGGVGWVVGFIVWWCWVVATMVGLMSVVVDQCGWL